MVLKIFKAFWEGKGRNTLIIPNIDFELLNRNMQVKLYSEIIPVSVSLDTFQKTDTPSSYTEQL